MSGLSFIADPVKKDYSPNAWRLNSNSIHTAPSNLKSSLQPLRVPGNSSTQDSLPKTRDVTVIIPFEYKQSSINFSGTFELMDSVAAILQMDDTVKFTINGYSYFDEGNDTICHYLSLNRALAVKSYIAGRGVDSLRIDDIQAHGQHRSIQRKRMKDTVGYNCTAEVTIHYPIPPPPDLSLDIDEDGILDKEDSCKNEYGYLAFNGCPDKNAIIVPFEPQQSSLVSGTYQVLDSVVSLLRKDPSITIRIEGHAYKKEAVETVCERLAKERADIVKRYLLTRQINVSRIDMVKSFGNLRPINAGRNPWERSRNSRAEIFLIQH